MKLVSMLMTYTHTTFHVYSYNILSITGTFYIQCMAILLFYILHKINRYQYFHTDFHMVVQLVCLMVWNLKKCEDEGDMIIVPCVMNGFRSYRVKVDTHLMIPSVNKENGSKISESKSTHRRGTGGCCKRHIIVSAYNIYFLCNKFCCYNTHIDKL